MEHLLQKSKYSIFHNIFKYMIFQRRQEALLWSKGLMAYQTWYLMWDVIYTKLTNLQKKYVYSVYIILSNFSTKYLVICKVYTGVGGIRKSTWSLWIISMYRWTTHGITIT